MNVDEDIEGKLKTILQVLYKVNPEELPISNPTGYYIIYWRKANKVAYSYILGLHFFHWKAKALPNKLTEVHAIMTHIFFHYGYSFWALK